MNGLDTLRALGVKKVHSKTLISERALTHIFNEDFEGIGPVHMHGFISILQREYHVDLSGLEEAYEQHRKEAQADDEEEAFLRTPSSDKMGKKIALLKIAVVSITIILVLGFMLFKSFSVDTLSEKTPVDTKIEKIAIKEPAKSALITKDSSESMPEITVTKESANLEKIDKKNRAIKSDVDSKEEIATEKIVIIPEQQVWIGVTNLDNNSRDERMTDQPVVLDATTRWLFLMGHGRFSLKVGERENSFNTADKVRIIYEDGDIRRLNYSEYKSYRIGEEW